MHRKHKGKWRRRAVGTLSLFIVPHQGALRTLKIVRYKGLASLLAVMVLCTGTAGTWFIRETLQENQTLKLTLEEERLQYAATLSDLNVAISDQTRLLQDMQLALNHFRVQESVADRTLDSYKAEYEEMLITYIDTSLQSTSVSRGEEGARSFHQDLATLKALLEMAEEASLDADIAGESLLETTASLNNYIQSLPSFWPTLPSYDAGSPFGRRLHPVYRYYRMHEGVDIGGKRGDPIYAAGDGVVVRAEWSGGYGYVVEINHGNQYSTRYAHCSKMLVTAGQKVKQGDLIAQIGSTGLSTGSHLHFEVRINNAPVDPELFISK